MIIKEKDIENIQKVLKGDKKSEKHIYEKYSKIVKDYIRRQSTSLEIDDDVADIMIKVFSNLQIYDENKSSFKSWVIGIAKNHMIDKWRKNDVLSGTFNIDLTNDTLTVSNNNVDNTFTVNNTTSCYDTTNAISYISSQMSVTDFTMLNMKYMQGYSYCEIGLEFNTTSSTVSNRVNYIKSKIKKNSEDIF